MRLKPGSEGSYQSWIALRVPNWFIRADPAPDQPSMEKLYSKTRVIADFSSPKMRASTTAEMGTKGMKRVEIDVRQNTASPLQEATEMDGGSNVSNSAGRGVSAAFEVICEGVDVGSTDSTPQPS
jgi:hypothetical protein